MRTPLTPNRSLSVSFLHRLGPDPWTEGLGGMKEDSTGGESQNSESLGVLRKRRRRR